MAIKKGDNVMVIKGSSKGKTGSVVRVLRDEGKVILDGINLKKRHLRPNRQTRQGGGIVERAHPISLSNVALIDPKSGKPTRIRIEVKDGKKSRIAVKSGAAV
jgi:large subunit ribosomal protein L24